MAKPTAEIQSKALLQVKEYFDCAKRLTQKRRQQLVKVYEAYSKFEQEKDSLWSSAFKVNKSHEVVENVIPRIMAKAPRWLVAARKPGLPQEHTEAIRDYLTYIWDEYNIIEPVKLWAKGMLVYGKSTAKIKYKYEVIRTQRDETTVDEFGNASVSSKMVEEVYGEYPTIDVKSFTDVYYDPRYIFMSDRPAEIEISEGVRLADLFRNKDKYFNLDKVEEAGKIEFEASKNDEYKEKIMAIAGLQNAEINAKLDTSSLTVKTYYGYFNETEDAIKEKMYKICVVADLFVISFEEISQIPFVEIKCFEDPETAHAVGLVEPIIGLQDELNFSKNSASEYINKTLQRQMVWSPSSGIDPRTINDPVIVTQNDGQTAINNFVELPHRQIDYAFFQRDNDIERQIQGLTHTIDTSNSRNQNALTDTATGARIKFFESNNVIEGIRKNFEAGLEQLAYKLLQMTFDNMKENIVFKKMKTEGYWDMNKELLRDAITKFSIKIEANSSSFDDLESRREDAIAFFNFSAAAAAAGVPVNLEEAYREGVATFEKKDPNKFIRPMPIPQITSGLTGRPIPTEGPEQKMSKPAALTQSVAQGGLTRGL